MNDKKIVITGGAGFIGSNLANKLNEKYYNKNIILVDNFNLEKVKNVEGVGYEKVTADDFINWWLIAYSSDIECIFHLGARTDTAEHRKDIFDLYNLEYSKNLYNQCVRFEIPLIYASSAATYGGLEENFLDNYGNISKLAPNNAYGQSKHDFDTWVRDNEKEPPNCIGLKFFNVYGKGEYHKGMMSSVMINFYKQLLKYGSINLFKSYRDNVAHGEQMRDFIYVDDVVDVIIYLFENIEWILGKKLFNLGSGKSTKYNDVANLIIKDFGGPTYGINYIDMPDNIKNAYQYYTCADISSLREHGYLKDMTTIDEGISKYIKILHDKYLNVDKLRDDFLSTRFEELKNV